MGSLPSGTVTFAFTDVEGSTELLERLGDEYAGLIARHRLEMHEAVSRHGGEVVDSRGEEFFIAFVSAEDAAAAAVAIQRRHADGPVRVRIGLHTGEPTLSADGYLGIDVHLAARICAAGHGGQILLTEATRDLLPGARLRDLGEHALKGITKPQRIFQLNETDLGLRFPPLRAEPANSGSARNFGSIRRRKAAPTLEEAGWAVRGRMVGVDDSARRAFSELGAALFAAGRADAEARRFLSRTDSRLMQKRLREHEELGTLSRHAREQAASIQRQLDLLGELHEGREILERTVPAALRATTASAALNLSAQVGSASARLDDALTRARAEIGTTALRLRRTRYAGVRRAGDLYAVPSIDEAGVESVPTFETLREARAYRRAQRLREKTFSSKLESDVAGAANLRRDSSRGRDTGPEAGHGSGIDGSAF